VILFFAILILLSLVSADSKLSPADVKVTITEAICGDNICNGNETISSCYEDCSNQTIPPSSSSSSSGGGSSSGSSKPNPSEINPVCHSNWECGDWRTCENFVRKRNCKDLNKCTEVIEREEEASCVIPTPEEIDKFFRKETPIIKIPIWFWLILLILLLIIYKLIRKYLCDKKKDKQHKKKKK